MTAQVAKLNQSWRSVAQVGDVLRACTCTNLVYATRSLLGVQAPVRTIVVFGADNQKWPKVRLSIMTILFANHSHDMLARLWPYCLRHRLIDYSRQSAVLVDMKSIIIHH